MQQLADRVKNATVHGRQWLRNRGHLRVFIAGAPKVGNMWLRMLLWHMYDLQQKDVTGVVSAEGYPRHGSFVTHQHVRPVPELLAWGDPLGVHYITMLRHPGDILLSLFHYVNNMAEKWKAAGRLGETPSHKLIGESLDSKAVLEYVTGHFWHECLDISVAWIKSGRASVVRYEDLHLLPEHTLGRLADELRPVSPAKIRAAVDACFIGNLQKVAGPRMRAHYRKGRVGDWETELPKKIVEAVADHYSDDLKVMSYSMGEGS